MVFQPMAYDCPPFSDESPREDKGVIEYESGLPYERQPAKRSGCISSEILDHNVIAMFILKIVFY